MMTWNLKIMSDSLNPFIMLPLRFLITSISCVCVCVEWERNLSGSYPRKT